jgi:hypothetical protein
VKSVFTVREVAQLLRRLDGRAAATERAVRYYARTGMVRPSGGRLEGDRGARLYTLEDIALVRLIGELRKKAHERAVWGLLVYRGAEVRQQLGSGRGAVILDDPAAMSVGDERAPTASPIRIPVALVLGGLRLAAERLRNQRPKLWTGSAWVKPTELHVSAGAASVRPR